MNDLELQTFYEEFVRTLRARGVVCAITSGLACVHYGIAETTKDCDLLCHGGSFHVLLTLLAETRAANHSCRYRGNISPPLDERWHAGGWTSHFEWGSGEGKVLLDVFGGALRESVNWQDELDGLYAGMQVVAEMKRTDRDKDWPFISSLGEQMLVRRDPRGWLHLYDADLLMELSMEIPIPEAAIQQRPVLQLVRDSPETLRAALLAERIFWQELDRLRQRVLRSALRPYVAAMGRCPSSLHLGLFDQHAVRLDCAEQHLAVRPLADFGWQRYIAQARENTARAVHPDLMNWLPDVTDHFKRYFR